jgi:hypothetical protein
MAKVYGNIFVSVEEIKNVYDKLVELGDVCPGCGFDNGFYMTVKDPEGWCVVSTDWILSCPRKSCDWTKDITDLDIYFGNP